MTLSRTPFAPFLTSPILLAAALSLPPEVGAQTAAAFGSEAEAISFSLPRATGPIVVDGVLDDPAWEDAVPVPIPFEWFPGDNLPAPVETVVFLHYDDEHLYLGFRALDPEPSRIRAHLADRDTPFQDDAVGFTVDPFDDERRAFQFRINPLGIQMDAVFSENEGQEDFSWDAIWDSGGRITEEGYEVEVALPFKSLRFARSDHPQTWGITLTREVPREVLHRLRSHTTDRDRSCLLCQMDKMEGPLIHEPGRNLELAPTLSATHTDRRPGWPSGSWDSGDLEDHIGITARWNVTPNLAVQGAVNPDFSHVEADVAQLDVNTRFAVNYPEKRPFFLEGADLFRTPLDAVYTRTVADPKAGAKISGKAGRHALGFFLTRDRVNTVMLPDTEGSRTGFLDGGVTGGVLRYRRDVGSRSTVGALVTAREGQEYRNWVYGVDVFWRLSPTNTLQGQYLQSFTDDPDDFALQRGRRTEAFQGDILFLEGQHQSRVWSGALSLIRAGDDFRADAGFMPRADLVSYQGALARTFWGDRDAWHSFLRLGVQAGRVEDLDGSLSEQQVQVFGEFSGPMQSAGRLLLTRRDEVFVEDARTPLRDGRSFHLVGGEISGEIRPSGAAALSLAASLGEALDYTNGHKGTLFTLRPQGELKLGRKLNLIARHEFQRMEHGGVWSYIANLSQLRASYNFNARSFVRAIVQFRQVDRHTDQYTLSVNPETQTLFTQLLFSYEVNPRTVLFLGYSDNSLGYLNMERIRTDLTRRNRTFYLKVGYAWRP
ncbi:DUF5916 domain-containing protein [Gemmatimonadota bacterium]